MNTFAFRLNPVGPFHLSETVGFLGRFAPAGLAPTDRASLDIAFPVDGDERSAGVHVIQDVVDGPVDVQVTSEAPEAAIRDQVARLLSLDHDATGFAGVGRRDPVVGRMLGDRPGFRPTGFWSPYEAAVWAIISHRVQMVQAARTKAAIGEQFGTRITVDGTDLVAFPAPGVLADATLDDVRGLGGRKPEWLRGVAAAALAGDLDATMLRSLPPEDAKRQLQRIPGVGPFSAELILVRGAMPTDVPVGFERRLVPAMIRAYELPDTTGEDELAAIVDGWSPFRTWTTVLVRAALDSTPGR